MSSNFERLHEIINEACAENFSCLSHWEPKKRHMWAFISENAVSLYESDVRHCTSLIKLDLYDPLVLMVDSNDGGRMGIKFRLGEGMVVEALAPKLSQELLVCTEMYFCTPFCWKASAM